MTDRLLAATRCQPFRTRSDASDTFPESLSRTRAHARVREKVTENVPDASGCVPPLMAGPTAPTDPTQRTSPGVVAGDDQENGKVTTTGLIFDLSTPASIGRELRRIRKRKAQIHTALRRLAWERTIEALALVRDEPQARSELKAIDREEQRLRFDLSNIAHAETDLTRRRDAMTGAPALEADA